MPQPIRIVAAVAAALVILVAFAQPNGGALPAFAAKKTPAPTATPTPTGTPPTLPPSELRAGLRASNYGITPFPSPAWWTDSIDSMASRFPNAAAEQIAVVVEVAGGGGRQNCWAHFPQPATGSYPNVNWDDTDLFESTFDAFDDAGIKVWLQVEPARCDVPMLIELLYRQYGHHASVIGFGVDVEWYRKDVSRTGKAVTDAEAAQWVALTGLYGAGDLVFLKHWLIEKMPPTRREGLVFIDDSQGHASLSTMVDEFSAWGRAFPSSPVGFQFGYQSDNAWWKNLSDPPGDIGHALLQAIPNTRDLIWVDFTAYDIWPPE
jgi:hypothetical protein